jgi:hypothetical protein
MREGLVKVSGMVVGSWVMEFEGSQLRRMSRCCRRTKDLLATPFQRCLDGVVFVPADEAVMVVVEEVEVEVEVEEVEWEWEWECLCPSTASRCDGDKSWRIIIVGKGDDAAAANSDAA